MVNKYLLIVFIFFLAACASIVPPTGGPIDETPPKVEKTSPPNNTLNFKEKGVDFTFDEYVVLNDITNQFIISPPLNEKPEIKIKGKKVQVVFKEDLKPNTTYTLNFGNGIKDNNEGNILSGLTYTFSTGDYIDSLSLNGTLIDAFTQLPIIDAAVGLYRITEDSTIFKVKPWYLTRPDSSGNFKFTNLSPAEYELVAFEDANRNLKIEANEKLAFFSSPIDLNYFEKDSNVYKLLLSPQYKEKSPKIITYKELAKGKYQIITLGSNCNFTINRNSFNKNETQLVSSTHKTCDTITVYTNNICTDSTSLEVTVDTITEKIVIKCKSKSYTKNIITSPTNFNDYNYLLPVRISFTNPPIEIREKEIKFFKSDSIEITDFKIVKESIDPLSIKLVYPFEKDIKYTLSIPKGKIKDLYGQDLDSTGISIKTATESFFGNLSIKVPNPDTSSLIVQLLDVQSNIVHENTITTKLNLDYKNLLPGSYFVKVIKDDNKNGVWDGGNYFTKKQPEKVYITPQSLNVRANWDISDMKIETGF
jgi:uncharacterized protein (DUF2141 family)